MELDTRHYQLTFYFLSLVLSEITHADDVGKDGLLAAQMLKGAITSYTVEKRYLRKNHETLWADLTATMIRDHDGRAVYGLMMIENIIERKRARLLEEEDMFHEQ